MKRTLGLYVAWLVATVMLVLAAVQRHPYGFYTLLRWICCAVFAYSAFTASEKNRVARAWIFGALAVLFNPIVPIHLQRDTWQMIDWATIGVILIVIVAFSAREIKATKQTTQKDEGEGPLRTGLTHAEEVELSQLGNTPKNQLTDFQQARWNLLDAKKSQAKAETSEKRWIIGLIIAAIVLFYLSIDAGIDDYKRFNKANRVVTGQVVELQEDYDEGGPSRSTHYQFKVDGIYYDGWLGNWDHSLAKGGPVLVHYNSSDPDFNHAEGDGPEHWFFNQWTFFGIICLIIIFMAVREGRKHSRIG
ncbi:MAG: hypothetical protein DMF26_03475 [Verrucomicrobia bacterium]|nr:MAG: hypothetical protein DMF26_03475 [Verrucomicrobiota bacterium]